MLSLLFFQSTQCNLELISLKKWITNPVYISTSHHIHNITSGWQNWMAMLINVSFVASPPLWSRLTLTTHGEQLHWPAELIAPTQDNDCNSNICAPSSFQKLLFSQNTIRSSFHWLLQWKLDKLDQIAQSRWQGLKVRHRKSIENLVNFQNA